jgi:Holliday junction resolvase RusA-like endonuclease
MIIHNGQELHTYTIPGTPIPWARPRISGKTFYDSQKPLKNNWAISLQYQHEGQPFYLKTPLHMIINFYFSPPNSLRPSKQNELLTKPYLYKGDLDNLCKFVLDNCNAILFDDDCTVWKIEASKSYDKHARTEFAFIAGEPQPLRGFAKKSENDKALRARGLK